MHYKDPNQNQKMENKIFGAKTFILRSLKSHNTKNETLRTIIGINPLNTKNWIKRLRGSLIMKLFTKNESFLILRGKKKVL